MKNPTVAQKKSHGSIATRATHFWKASADHLPSIVGDYNRICKTVANAGEPGRGEPVLAGNVPTDSLFLHFSSSLVGFGP